MKFDYVSPFYEEVGQDFRRIEFEHRNSDWESFRLFLETIPLGHLKQMLQSILAKKAESKYELLVTKGLLKDNPGVEDYINRRLGLNRKTSV